MPVRMDRIFMWAPKVVRERDGSARRAGKRLDAGAPDAGVAAGQKLGRGSVGIAAERDKSGAVDAVRPAGAAVDQGDSAERRTGCRGTGGRGLSQGHRWILLLGARQVPLHEHN